MDYTYENLKEMIKHESDRVVLAMMHFHKHPEDGFQIVYDIIENEDAIMFRHLSKINTIQQVYQQIPDSEPTIWDEILKQGKYDFLTKIINDKNANLSYADLREMHGALRRKSTLTNEPKNIRAMNNVYHTIVSKESHLTRMVQEADVVLDSQQKGDYPDITIGTPGEKSYLFKGIQRKDIQDDKLSEALKKTAVAYFKHAYETALPDDKIDFDHLDSMQMSEKKTFSDVELEYDDFMHSFETVYNASLSQADEFAAARSVFAKSAHKGLLIDFEKKGGSYVLVAGNHTSINGQSSGGCITLVNEFNATLYHELIHEFDTQEHKISDSPFFKKVFTYMDEELEKHVTHYLFGQKSFWTFTLHNKKEYNARGKSFNPEYLPFFATMSHTRYKAPSFVKTALRFIDTLALAKATGNKQVEDSLMQSLQNDNVEMTQKAFDDYMKSAIRLAQGKPLTVAKRKNNIADIVKQNQR